MSELPNIELRNVSVEFPFHVDAARGVRHLRTEEEQAGSGVHLDSISGAPFYKRGGKFFALALSEVDLEISSGDRVGLIGHNGAGKSTLIRVMAGLLEPTGGSIKVVGRIACTTSTTFGFDMRLTGRENVIRRGLMMRMSKSEIAARMDSILDFAELGHYIDMPMGTYSSGMRARLGFAITTCVDADVLIMDEWIGAGDPRFLEKCEARLSELVNRAKILVLASHREELLKRLCNKFVVLDKGQLTVHHDFETVSPASDAPTAEQKRVEAREKMDALRTHIGTLRDKNIKLKAEVQSLRARSKDRRERIRKLRANAGKPLR